ncbi:hypothetical protein MCOR27_001707 [Pyricularia oryzae]|uniref:Uncharacterized protein n=1 Tax=Pyricularia grisea TaxID=148305 RepID=A0ABQ8NEW8_PYRGI|nr:hypothetical protein MCOR01_011163 [Pyricularia oryzae]KAI6295906.1 hypothetical protein MCOR33_007335 [Pyricularia grisea]KAI6254410.1 hypothetical protein MCOR19_009090 [Pyricularia oryzae]KAI6263963.1 hypothetical protein MCOR26_011698 [Pyricularia oryzae]KAI6286794.1 hypothetical protein MCOR27_001707 [Pyricularia oryzae]
MNDGAWLVELVFGFITKRLAHLYQNLDKVIALLIDATYFSSVFPSIIAHRITISPACIGAQIFLARSFMFHISSYLFLFYFLAVYIHHQLLHITKSKTAISGETLCKLDPTTAPDVVPSTFQSFAA